MANGSTISVKGVSKWFGSVVAVNDVSLEIGPGITGLLGPNGAGKTTLLHMMTGLSAVSAGEITVLGEHPRGNNSIYGRIGVMMEHQSVYEILTGRQFVRFSARLQGLENPDEAVTRAINAVGMADAQDRALSEYSRGMRQRMRLAATMVHDPEVLVLDEPLNGTDPRQRLEFHDLARRLAAEGRTIVISSHILEEVETLADTILLMVSGKLAASGNFRAIRALLDDRPYQVRVTSSGPRELGASLIASNMVDSVTMGDGDELTFMTRELNALQLLLPRIAQEQNVDLFTVEPLDESLESVFTYVVER